MSELATLEIRDKLAWVTIDNPPMNALGDQAKEDLGTVLDRLEELQEEIWAVIVTGAGQAFVAGSDIKKFLSLDAEAATAQSMKTQALFRRLETYKRPTIAAINGYCFGAGVELALCCDLRAAAESAVLGSPEVSLGIIPGAGATQRLPRLVGLGRARDLIMSGRRIKAEEALRIGLVEKIAPSEDLLAEAERTARQIMSRGPAAVAAAKRVINRGWGMEIGPGLELESRIWGELFDTADQKEGAAAFIEKRKPEFQGR